MQRLNDAELNPLRRLRNWREVAMLGTHEPDRNLVEQTLGVLYAAHELHAPRVVFCEGPLALGAYITSNWGRFIGPAPFDLERRSQVGRIRSALVGDTQTADEIGHLANFPTIVTRSEGRAGFSWDMGGQRIRFLPYMFWLRDWWVVKQYMDEAIPPNWRPEVDSLLVLAEHSFCVFFSSEDVFVVMKPCEVHVDQFGRAHNRGGAAVVFRDEYRVNALCGAAVSDEIMKVQHELTVQHILTEGNTEVRRALIELFGAERFLNEYGGKLLDATEYGELYRSQLEGQEDLVMVRVRNSSPEPDGTYKWYTLRVPPNMRTAHEAVAWTFGMTTQQYKPVKET